MYTYINRTGIRALAVITALSMIISAFPVGLQFADAATASTISASVVANPAADPEYFEISYTGTAQLDLTGWTVEDVASTTYTFGSVVLTNGDSYQVCQNAGATTSCDAVWNISPVWNNGGDTFVLRDANGEVILEFSFGDVGEDVSSSDSVAFDVLGTTGGDKISICHATESESNPFVAQQPNVNSFFNGGHDSDFEDIIPPFFYNVGNGIEYFAGMNWDAEGEAFLANDCSDPEAETGSITIVKEVVSDIADWSFDFEGDLDSFTLTDESATKTVTGLVAGEYAVDELIPDGWSDPVVDCSDENSGPGQSKDQLVVVLEEGEDVTCTFTNRKPTTPDPDPLCQIGDNLLVNPSFEEPAVEGNWAFLPAVGWTSTKVSNGTTDNLELQKNVSGWDPSDGLQYAELAGNERNRVSQTVATDPSATYELRFDFSARPGTNEANNNVQALIGGTVKRTDSADGTGLQNTEWETLTHQFVATGTAISVALQDNGTNDGLGTFVDNAVLCKVAEAPQCVDEPDGGWADGHSDFTQGNLKNGSDVLASRSNPDEVLGEADWTEGQSTGFASLGFGGSIVVAFDSYVPDVDGDDISIHEATNGNYPAETALVEVSQDKITWLAVGTASNLDNTTTRESYFDFASTGLPWIKYVRVTDTSNPALHSADADGFDLDAVDATETVCDEPQDDPEPEGKIKVFKWVKNQNPHDVAFEDFSFQVASDTPLSFNQWGFGFVKKPVGHTYEINEVDIPDDYEHVVTICKVFSKKKYSPITHGPSYSVDSSQMPLEMHSFTSGFGLNLLTSNTVTLEDEHDFGVCLIINKYEDDDPDPDPDPVCEADVNLIQNGSFEDPEVTHGAGWNIFAEGVAGLAWLVDWVSPNGDATDPASLELHGGVNGWLPASGDQYAELDGDYGGPDSNATGEPASTRISQTIDTIAGEEYTLSWKFSPRPGTLSGDNDLHVFVDGGDVASNDGSNNSNQTVWTSDSYTFIATGTETTILFEDQGTPNSLGTFLDDVSLVCNPEPTSGPYCGDGSINQDWEQCEIDDEGCTDYCTYENQCTDLRLVKITIDENAPVSESFDGVVYLGDDQNPIPNGTWFNFDETGDETAQSIAVATEGLGVERDIDAGTLNLAFEGGNGSKKLDYIVGSIDTIGIDLGTVDRSLVPGFVLENVAPAFIDVFDATDTHVDFDLRADTGNDGVSVEVGDDELICEPEERFTLTVTMTGEGSGLVASDDESESASSTILCFSNATETDCAETYASGTVVTLIATADEGSNFDNSWSVGAGTCTGNTTPCQVTMTSNIDLVAHFDLDTVTTSGGGGGGGRSRGRSSSSGGSGGSEPNGEVLGEQVSVVPVGAPDAGAGGAASTPLNTIMLAVFSTLGFVLRKITHVA